jgi:hypothetical protein
MPSEGPGDPDPVLLAAYRAAEYVVPIGARLCPFHPDRPAPGRLDTWLADHGPAGWLSAFNPGSRRLTILDNLRRHDALWRRLRSEGRTALAGYATDPSGEWPDEPSLLVPGIGLEPLNRLALEFGQIAFLWLEPRQPVRLLLADPSGPRPV